MTRNDTGVILQECDFTEVYNMSFQSEKKLVLEYYEALEKAPANETKRVMEQYLSEDFTARSSYPFRDTMNRIELAEKIWTPYKTALTSMQRRQDIFIAGNNTLDEEGRVWVMSMGHFMGVFSQDILGIRHTGKMANLRYTEFDCVVNGKITETCLMVDYIGLMKQAGMDPLPPSTGNYFVYPGPRMHNGLLFEDADPAEGDKTMALVNQMVDDLSRLNASGSMEPPSPSDLAHSWSEDMIWYGPSPIGASYTIPGYIKGHTGPFRRGLGDKVFNGHVVRFAEGDFACFFGWPNLSNRNIGGFLGLPAGSVVADMQVTDVYCRVNDKLTENWVIIDLPWWLKQQGLDVFERTSSILNPQD